MESINFERSYPLGKDFETIKGRAYQYLAHYLGDFDLMSFSRQEHAVKFSSACLIPHKKTGRPRVMFLLNNPHPASIQQGMFLAPEKEGRQRPFWHFMEESGWFDINVEESTPETLKESFLEVDYNSAFEILFHCYYPFPVEQPEHTGKIFGKSFLKKVIDPQSRDEFVESLSIHLVSFVLAFSKQVYNSVAEEKVGAYQEKLDSGELIKSRVALGNGDVPIYLTYPPGWRSKRNYRDLRVESLRLIREDILASFPEAA